jgi:hypothetical protein
LHAQHYSLSLKAAFLRPSQSALETLRCLPLGLRFVRTRVLTTVQLTTEATCLVHTAIWTIPTSLYTAAGHESTPPDPNPAVFFIESNATAGIWVWRGRFTVVGIVSNSRAAFDQENEGIGSSGVDSLRPCHGSRDIILSISQYGHERSLPWLHGRKICKMESKG